MMIDYLYNVLPVFIVIGALFLWTWKVKQDLKQGFSIVAISFDSLSGMLAILFAWQLVDGILALFLLVAFIGLVLAKVLLFGAIVEFHTRRKWTPLMVTVVITLLVYGSVFVAGTFHGIDSEAEQAAAASAKSLPVEAINTQISYTQERISALAAFANAEKAHAETRKLANQQAANQARVLEIQQALLAPAPEFPHNFAQFMTEDCTPKRDHRGVTYRTKAEQLCEEWRAMQSGFEAKKQALRVELQHLQNGTGTASSYADKHAEYLGLQAHLIELQKQRTDLLQSDATVAATAYGGAYSFVAELFGATPAQVAGWLWLALTLFFDFLSLFLRLIQGWLRVDRQKERKEAERKRLNTLLDAGVSPSVALAMGNQTQQQQRLPSPQYQQKRAPGFVRDDDTAADTQTVPMELSGQRNSSRIGLVDTCVRCGAPFTVHTYHHVKCPACSTADQSSYRAQQCHK